MSENNGLRLTVVLALFFGSLAIIFSPVLGKLWHPTEPIDHWVNLKPGIDMVGGTSLVYEIIPGGAPLTGHLATDVSDKLKHRVDPKGVKNLIWRPQGDTRLEIQMPLSLDAKSSAENRQKMREDLIAAKEELKKTNITLDKVISEIEKSDPKIADVPASLATDSKARQKLIKELKELWNGIQKARDEGDAQTWARLEKQYREKQHPADPDKRSEIDEINLSREQLDNVIANDPKEGVKEGVKKLKEKFADFPSRVKAIDHYVDANTKLNSNQGGLDDATDLKRLLKGAGVLEYHILAKEDMPDAKYREYATRLQAEGPRSHTGDDAKWFEVDKQSHLRELEYHGKSYVLGYITPGPDGPRSLDGHAEKSWHLTDAHAIKGQAGDNEVSFSFDPQGAAYFAEMTGANLKKPMAIVLDNKVISAPTIQSKISSTGTISGGGSSGFDEDELKYLVSTLQAGSLPAALSDEPISERTVGPQLGADNLNAGLIACFLGLIVVAVFLCSYYYLAGVVATGAVIMNVLLVLAVMSALNATFTLPSIAGIVLSVGTAVDANVLIFERLREEQHRGLSLRLALRNAYGKAFSAILDSNMTTAITSAFLIFFGTEEVKGFGVTLLIGIAASLFTALFVTRTVFTVLMEKFGVKQLRSLPLVYPKWDRMLRPNIDWMGKAWIFITISCIALVIGLVMFVVQVNKGEMMGIEFASGTSVQFKLAKPMPQKDLRTLMEKRIKEKKVEKELDAFAVVTVGTDDTTYELVTPNANAVHVRDALLKVLVDKDGRPLLAVDVPSKFDGMGGTMKLVEKDGKQTVQLDTAAKAAGTGGGATSAESFSNLIIPLEGSKTPPASEWPNRERPDEIMAVPEPGVAVVLKNLDPPLSHRQIVDRIEQLQLPEGSKWKNLDITVLTPDKELSEPATTAIIITRKTGDILFSEDRNKWQETLAEPLWELVNLAINRPAQLQQVKNFDPQVANEAARDALLALILSIAVIMVYIWFRFGNLKYGTATMVALIHDVLFTIAALGFAHYLWQVPVIGKLFQLEAFRIDLTVVAGILTIMGYSMIDTIVVFDRIRENRGKFGLVSRKTVNDAINQTLSRTLLTAGTNVVTVAIMYFLGGPGIHGFTFVLLIGILVGTYSSVVIAAPILLLGRQEEEASQARGKIVPAKA